jgi:hypothetical protein
MRKAPNLCLEATLNAGSTPARMRFGIQDEEVPAENPQSPGMPPLGGESGDNGKIRVCDLYPGRFRISVAQPTANNSVITGFVGELPVILTNADLSGLNAATQPRATLLGEVAWDKPPADSSLRPIIGMRLYPDFSGPATRVSVPGEFAFPVLPTVAHNLAVYPQVVGAPVNQTSLYVKDITYGATSIMYGAIRPGDASARLRVIVGNDAGSITISAARADGKPADATAILLLPALARTEGELALTLRSAITDERGTCQLTTVPPGRYYVVATNDPPLGQTLLPSGTPEVARTPETLGLLMRARSSGQLVEVGPGATAQVRVTPKPLE